MSRYMVECSIGTIWVEVEAGDEEEAIDAAMNEWSASDIIGDGTFSVRELEADVLRAQYPRENGAAA